MEKIYITLAEAEKVIFNKILVIEAERLALKKAQKQYSVAIIIHDHRLVSDKKSDKMIVLISAIEKFEIPKEDQSIFLNTYKVPCGLIKAVPRKVKDPAASTINDFLVESFNDQGSNLWKLNHYQYIRRALLHVFYEMVKLRDDSRFCTPVLQTMNNLVSLDDFTSGLVCSVIDENTFPTVTVETDGFMPNSYFNWAWWGKFTRDTYLDITGLSEEEILISKAWLKEFDPRTFRFDALNNLLESVPSQLKEISALLVGYYLAFIYKDRSSIERFREQYPSGVDDESSKLIFWNLFFEGLFDESIDFLYATELVDDQFWEIDKRALQLATVSKDDDLGLAIADLEIPNWENADAAKSVYALLTGRDGSELVVLDPRNVLDAFDDFFRESPLYASNKAKVGIIDNSEKRYEGVSNYIFYRGDGFVFEQADVDSCDVIYYGEFRNGNPPATIRVKRKPLDALIPKGKAVLLFFYNLSNNDGILDLYTRCISHHQGIKQIIIVWDVPCTSDELQTLQFDAEKTRMKNEYSEKFAKPVTLLVKSKFNSNHAEIIRLLRQSLATFKLKEIEVVDKNLNATYAEWLIKASDHFLIADPKDSDICVNTW